MSETKSGLPILGFASSADWEAWLAAQPADSPGLWLKLAKSGSGVSSVSKPEAIEGALIHGWIDGQLETYDDRFWLTRFTPRKARSKWSANNRATALALIAAGRMAPAGQAQVDAAQADGRWDAAYAPQSRAEVPDDLAAALDASPAAKALFDRLDAANRYAVLYRVHDARTDKTRAARIDKFVTMLARGETIYPLKAKG
uniref:Bacteriocin-protection protein n=1 Tax=Caulobacter sp. (strain K31) TaxID=366602 RepID=B0T607_CAUSK